MKTSRASVDGLKAFTLVELLVVIAIVSVLVSMLLPSLSQARAVADDVKCAARIRQSGVVFQAYFNDFKRYMPPLVGKVTPVAYDGTSNVNWAYSYGSWYPLVRGYAGYTNAYTTVAADKPHALSCSYPSADASGFPYYAYCVNWYMRFRVWGNPNTSYRDQEFRDPAATALMFDGGQWMDTIRANDIPQGLAGHSSVVVKATHGGRGAGAVFFDGHGKFISVPPGSGALYTPSNITALPFDTPFLHAAFWGRFVNGQYLSIPLNPPPYTP